MTKIPIPDEMGVNAIRTLAEIARMDSSTPEALKSLIERGFAEPGEEAGAVAARIEQMSDAEILTALAPTGGRPQ